MVESRGAKVFNIADAAAKRKKSGAFKSGTVKAEQSADRRMSRDVCISVLEILAPVPESLKGKLNLPETMHSVSATSTSLSSEPGKSVMALAGFLLLGAPFPEGLPDYGIHITTSGSNTFAILYDSARKIIVCESVENVYAENGSWSSFESSLSDAVSAAGMFKREGRQFQFAVVKDGLISSI
jgi:hypothetical protein